MEDRQNEIYTIICVMADEVSLFAIKIESSESVSTLRAKIWEENKNTPAFAEIAARHLKLYHVEISGLEYIPKDELETAVKEKLSDNPAELHPKKKLANIFNGGPKDETLIIVQSPTSGK